MCFNWHMPDIHYENAVLAELYDLDSPWSEDREFYLRLAGREPQRILDLGCGTGLIADAYAGNGHTVTGVDPAAAMLERARLKPNGGRIDWVLSKAQNFKSDKRFDLIIMTGHAFQVLLDDEDILATFATMAEHLAPNGQIVFESRNPAIDWTKSWNYRLELTLAGSKVIESRKLISMDGERMKFELQYEFPDSKMTSNSELRFLRRKEVEERVSISGLRIIKVLGDWKGASFRDNDSQEMIFFVSQT